MNVEVSCPHCATQFTVRRDLLGKRTKCTKCGQVFVITERTPGSTAPPLDAPIFQESPPPTREPATSTELAIETATRPASGRFSMGESLGFEGETAQPRFPALRIVARLYEILSIFALAFAALALVLLFIAVIRQPGNILSAILGSGLTIFWALMTAITLLFLSQSIRLGLQVERNTREIERACRQLADHLCAIQREP